MRRQANSYEFITLCQGLESKVRINNSSGLTDINTLSENFFCHLLNKFFDLNLVNINLEKLNFPAIDLEDSTKRRSFQITSDSSKSKIVKTLKRFDDHDLCKSYDTLDIVVIVINKKKIKEKLSLTCGVAFDKDKNVMDLSGLNKIFQTFEIKKQEIILDCFREELGSTNSIRNNSSTEVQTLIDLVGYLTKNKNLTIGSWQEEPDPEKKIKQRFSKHSEYLEKEILRLLPLYSNAKEQVIDVLGLDSVNVEFIRTFLKTKSESFLADSNGDPKKALDNFTLFLEEKMGVSGVKYDNQAIRFYLIDELIKCNVFPN